MNALSNRPRRLARGASGLLLVGLLVTGTPAPAGAGWWIWDTTKNGVVTGAHAARDGALTFGRSTKALFVDGPSAARSTWKRNSATTKSNARANGRATEAAATR
jgi:hypothetical protein